VIIVDITSFLAHVDIVRPCEVVWVWVSYCKSNGHETYNVKTFGDQNSFQLGGVIQMDLGNITKVSEVSQEAQNGLNRQRKGKIQSSQNSVKMA
jgi:hypothetical protein